MKLVYVHHAERDRSNKDIPRQEQDITLDGIKEAELLAKKIPLLGVTKIYSSEYIRCIHTAEILNKNLGLDIILEPRFNEKETGETWKEFLDRNKAAIQDIIDNGVKEDVVLCISSGVNLSAFVSYFDGADDAFCQALTMSPVLFKTKDDFFY